MQLSDEDINLFYKLHSALLQFVNSKENILPGVHNAEILKNSGIKNIEKVRKVLWKDPSYIGQFVSENPFEFPADELAVVADWKHFLRGNFFILSHLQKYTIFLDSGEEPKAYGVISLISPLEEVISYVPAYVEAVLLPFKGHIIYDGILYTRNIRFGGGYRRSLQESYGEAKARFGIVTTLPFLPEEESSQEKLIRLMRTEGSRIENAQEIEALTSGDRNLLRISHEIRNKAESRKYARDLKLIGITGWFVLLQGHIIASGTTREEAERNSRLIVPMQRHDLIYIFEVKKKE